jgi:glutathione S-transferase
MMTLYHSPATAAMVVHWLLIELELPHRLHPLDFDKREQKSPAYLKLNPAGVVPTLLIDDGPPICEAVGLDRHDMYCYAYA